MKATLRHHWGYTWAEIWEPLGRPEEIEDEADGEDEVALPVDLYMVVFRTVSSGVPPEQLPFDTTVAANDPTAAAAALQALGAGLHPTEVAARTCIEEVYQAIVDLDVDGLAERYVKLVEEFIDHHNLPYRLVEPCELQPLATGSFDGFYAELYRLSRADAHLRDLWDDFEHSFGVYIRSQKPADLKRCINNASSFAEGLAGQTAGAPGSLGELCRKLTSWPHSTIQAALGNLYGFCSNYPGIRHAGNPASKLRDLEIRDAVLVCTLLIAFSGYLTESVDASALVGLA